MTHITPRRSPLVVLWAVGYKAALWTGLTCIGLSLLLFATQGEKYMGGWVLGIMLGDPAYLAGAAGLVSLAVSAIAFVKANKRWRIPLITSTGLVVVTLATRFALEKRSERKRQLVYQTITNRYAEELREGTTRQSVERYLRFQGKEFQRFCCVGARTKAWADRVRIGQEQPPFFCSQHNVYVVFVFDALDPSVEMSRDGNDRLVEVKLYPVSEVCM